MQVILKTESKEKKNQNIQLQLLKTQAILQNLFELAQVKFTDLEYYYN